VLQDGDAGRVAEPVEQAGGRRQTVDLNRRRGLNAVRLYHRHVAMIDPWEGSRQVVRTIRPLTPLFARAAPRAPPRCSCGIDVVLLDGVVRASSVQVPLDAFSAKTR